MRSAKPSSAELLAWHIEELAKKQDELDRETEAILAAAAGICADRHRRGVSEKPAKDDGESTRPQ